MSTKCDLIYVSTDALALELDRVDAFFCEYLAHQIIKQKLNNLVHVREHSSDSVEFVICQNGLSQKRDQVMYALGKHLLGSIATLSFLGLIDAKKVAIMDAVLAPPIKSDTLDVTALIAAGFLVRNNVGLLCDTLVPQQASRNATVFGCF